MSQSTDGGSGTETSNISEILNSLNAIEEKILKLLEIASTTAGELSNVNPQPSSEIALKTLSTEYIALVKEVHQGLKAQVSSIGEYIPYERSSYIAKKELDIARMKGEVILSHFSIIKQILEGDTSMS
eukprot:TRINITY_DN3340_c0_g1_i1.p1 TRINITY_DN3340_c0_g1~~TRINITY_DN3340_c0_g1_i1.p1  ORF type:complete len:128 (-),score=23.01 TRINITY_DN3340_c0_g1_i1:88-471(-)